MSEAAAMRQMKMPTMRDQVSGSLAFILCEGVSPAMTHERIMALFDQYLGALQTEVDEHRRRLVDDLVRTAPRLQFDGETKEETTQMRKLTDHTPLARTT